MEETSENILLVLKVTSAAFLDLLVLVILLDQEHLSAAESSPVYSGVESTTDEDR